MVQKLDPKRLRYSICVSGASSGQTVASSANLAIRVGAAIANNGMTLTTGATIGLPYYAARGCHEAGGMSIGFSPAASLREHVRKYRLPKDVFNFINFTGLHYAGRDMYLVQSSDAIITIGGRFGSLHEFTSALENHKPCGILVGTGGTADTIANLVKTLDPSVGDLVIYDDNPEKLVERLIKVLDEKYADIQKDLQNHDDHWFLREGQWPIRQG